MGVSKNSSTPKSSFSIGVSIINHPFWGNPIFGNIHICTQIYIYIYIFNLVCRRMRFIRLWKRSPAARSRSNCVGFVRWLIRWWCRNPGWWLAEYPVTNEINYLWFGCNSVFISTIILTFGLYSEISNMNSGMFCFIVQCSFRWCEHTKRNRIGS